MIDLIKEEIKKDNPDWLLISNLSQKIYLESNKANLLGIRENVINLVKVGTHGVGDVVDLLKPIFPGRVIGVGGYKAMTVNAGVKVLKARKDNETMIIVTDRDALIKHLGPHQFFRCNIQNQYNNNKITVKWTNVDTGEIISFEPSELKSMIREQKINEILN
jgi:ABC-type enterochelin transport system substrate-binding protein